MRSPVQSREMAQNVIIHLSMDMERLPNFKERKKGIKETIEALKPAFVSLCLQMKDKIDSGYWTSLVSDEGGGRIPTLIFRQIIKARNENKEIKTVFVASGKTYLPEPVNSKGEHNYKYGQLVDHLKNTLSKEDKVLLVTQYIHSGSTINNMIVALKDSGIDTVDVATLDNNGSFTETIRADDVFVGGTHNRLQANFFENHTDLSGISKHTDFDPVPMRLEKAIEEHGREKYVSPQEINAYFGIEPLDSWQARDAKMAEKKEEYESIVKQPISEEEKVQIQDNINESRKAIVDLVEDIVNEVWNTRHEG